MTSILILQHQGFNEEDQRLIQMFLEMGNYNSVSISLDDIENLTGKKSWDVIFCAARVKQPIYKRLVKFFANATQFSLGNKIKIIVYTPMPQGWQSSINRYWSDFPFDFQFLHRPIAFDDVIKLVQ